MKVLLHAAHDLRDSCRFLWEAASEAATLWRKILVPRKPWLFQMRNWRMTRWEERRQCLGGAAPVTDWLECRQVTCIQGEKTKKKHWQAHIVYKYQEPKLAQSHVIYVADLY